jgi:phosphatidylserine/phosphatidylglycerophosphate/cardiolipin synthase-like enzyme
MPASQALEAFAARTIRRLFGPLHRRRRRLLPRHSGVTDEALRRARTAWWADDPRWYRGGTPPRRHNRVTPLIDGERYFAALAEALAQAQAYVYVVGWCLTPHIPFKRPHPHEMVQTRLLALLSETAPRVPVRILLWSGAPFLLQPTTRTMKAVQQAIAEQCPGDIQCRLDHSAHISHCHHQKAIVIDGRIAFVGGMDLTTFQGDRWDTPQHPLRAGPNWHDVQVRIEGEAAADVEHNFRQRWLATAGAGPLPHREPAWEESWQTPVQIVRTIPRGVYPFAPRGEYGIHHAYTRALRGAQRLIYLENQYLWSPDVVDALIAAMNKQHTEPFRIVIVLPARAYSGKWDNDQHVAKLREVDDGRGIVSVYSLYTSGPSSIGVQAFTYRPIYVHAKVAIVDDEWLTVGSANLNNRGLITDSEINAVVRDPELARNLRVDLWAEHLALPREQVAQADPIDLADHHWPDRAAENAQIITRGDRPLNCAAHRYEVGRMPGAWLLEEVEALTFEY